MTLKPLIENDPKKVIAKALEYLNNTHGQIRPMRIYNKSFDYGQYIHFEFSDIYGLAAFRIKDDGRLMFMIIKEDDDTWYVPNNVSYSDAGWITSLCDVVTRMKKFIDSENNETTV
jgi:hypothetical protein